MNSLRLAVPLVLVLAGCATDSGALGPGSRVLLEPPREGCSPLGAMAVRTSTELLMSEDVLRSSAIRELRRRAALRGATHLVISGGSSRGALSYGTTAAVSGLAFRCDHPL